jgi:hypothetical protein
VTTILSFILAATTILNASIVKVDRARAMITVRVDSHQTRQLPVAPAATSRLARLKAGNAVLLTLRGNTVVGIAMSAGGGGRVMVVSPGSPAAAGPQQIPQLPPGASSPTSRGIPQLPAGANSPQGRPVPQVPPTGGARVIGVSPSPGLSPPAVAPRPAVSPVSVASPKSPGTPKPVVLPSDPPPTPIPSPLP